MRHKKNANNYLVIVLCLSLAISIFGFVYVIGELNSISADQDSIKHTTAHSTATLRMCVNNAPQLVNDCNFTIPWGYNYTCALQGLDGPNTQFSYSSIFLTPDTLFQVSENGIISFVPPKDSIGNHTVQFTIYDDSGCANYYSSSIYNMSIYDTNHPPALSSNIPNQSMSKTQSVKFYLSYYFTDIDGDVLNYTYDVIDGANVTDINLTDSLVSILGLECGVMHAVYTAIDPSDESAQSNVVKYTVNCPPAQVDPGSSGSGSGGGGGGGGSYIQCDSDWVCDKWSICLENGTMSMRCVDHKACNPDDYIKTMTKNCTYVPEDYVCEENWNCTEWSECTNNNRTRTCRDMNSCGTYKNRPQEVIGCDVLPSCFNGIKDGDERGIDCGGSCKACIYEEMPLDTQRDKTMLILTVSSVLIIAGLVLYLLRSELKRFYMYTAKLMNASKTKPVYFTEKQKTLVLRQHNILSTRFTSQNTVLNLNPFLKEYFGNLLHIDHMTLEEINAALPALKNKELSSILLQYYKKCVDIETAKRLRSAAELQEIIDESFGMIYLVSEFTSRDALIAVKERKLTGANPHDSIYIKISNAYIALEFKQTAVVHRLYDEILADYSKLGSEGKQKIYADIVRLYENIKYLEKFKY